MTQQFSIEFERSKKTIMFLSIFSSLYAHILNTFTKNPLCIENDQLENILFLNLVCVQNDNNQADHGKILFEGSHTLTKIHF